MSDLIDEREEQEAPSDPSLDSPDLYFNRELSWLHFNHRLLQLAEGDRLPLLERVKFLSIYTSNLDEFFMVRVAGHHDQVDAGIEGRGPDGLTANETIDRVAERVRELDDRETKVWESVLRPALGEQGIRIVNCEECDDGELRAA